MKFVLLLISALNVYSEYPKQRVNITHDYMYSYAVSICETHKGFHYMVHVTNILSNRSSKKEESEDYPCNSITKIRCQDGTLLEFNKGVAYCFISEEQLQETLKN